MCIKPLFFYDLSPIFFNRGIECSSLSTLNINLCITFWCYILSGSIGGILGLVQSVQMILKVSFVFYYVDLSLVIIFLKKKKICYIIIYCGIIEQPMLFEVFLNQTDVVWNFNFMLNYIDLDFFLFIAAILFWSPSFVKHFLQSQHIKITIFTKMPENQGYIKIK